jgi:hypothetical protein
MRKERASPGPGSGNEAGILVNGPDNKNAVIRGPGLVKGFRGSFVLITNSSGAFTGVTSTQNCNSILLGGGSDHVLERKNGGAIIDHEAPRERRFAAAEK